MTCDIETPTFRTLVETIDDLTLWDVSGSFANGHSHATQAWRWHPISGFNPSPFQLLQAMLLSAGHAAALASSASSPDGGPQ
jgi:hypothetical protein